MRFMTKGWIYKIEDKNTSYGECLEVTINMSLGHGDNRVKTYSKGSAWGKVRERIIQKLVQGQKVWIMGSVKQANLFTRRNGDLGLGLNFTLEDIEILEEPNDDDRKQGNEYQGGYRQPEPSPEAHGWGSRGYDSHGGQQSPQGQNSPQPEWGSQGASKSGDDPIPF